MRGSIEEAQLALNYSYPAWVETRGALGLVKEKDASKEWVAPGGFSESYNPPILQIVRSPYSC